MTMDSSIIYSMTGYGEASCQWMGQDVTVQIISLNSRGFDLQTEVPRPLKKQLVPWQKLLEEQLMRGRIELQITLRSPLQQLLTQDKERIKAYFSSLKHIAQELGGSTDLLGWTFRFLLAEQEQETTDPIPTSPMAPLEKALQEALKDCLKARAQEGERLAHHLRSCIDTLKIHIQKVHDYLPKRKTLLQQKLLDKKETLQNTEEQLTWEREFAQYADKISLEEEVVRLQSHTTYLLDTLAKGNPIGKSLGFIVQEMVREVNTIGAKAQDVTLQHLAIQIKEVLEQIKEQAQNIL